MEKCFEGGIKMAKRMTDTEIWQKEWFLKYSLKQKVLLRFLFDSCDCAGVYDPNYMLLKVYIGEDVTEDDILGLNQDKIHIELLEDGKFFIPDFVSFQCGELSENCRPHIKVIETLKKHGLYEKVCEGYVKGINTLEEKNKTKNKTIQDRKGGAGGKQKIQPEEKHLKIAQRLKSVVSKKKKIEIDVRTIFSWANSIRLLEEKDKVSYERIEKSMDWYERGAYGDYVPVIESGESFRDKFLKLEAAIERDEDPSGTGGF